MVTISNWKFDEAPLFILIPMTKGTIKYLWVISMEAPLEKVGSLSSERLPEPVLITLAKSLDITYDYDFGSRRRPTKSCCLVKSMTVKSEKNCHSSNTYWWWIDWRSGIRCWYCSSTTSRRCSWGIGLRCPVTRAVLLSRLLGSWQYRWGYHPYLYWSLQPCLV